MFIPAPILLASATPGRLVLPVDGARGGLSGYVLTGQSGPPCTVEISSDGEPWQAVTYPHTLSPGERLGLTRTDSSGLATVLAALAPLEEQGVEEPEPFTVTTDADGYQTIQGATATTDADGYQTIQGATATADADGYESVERSD